MDKLTKEQAEWVIERLIAEKEIIGGWNVEHTNAQIVAAVGRILKQCTEKEFPAFKINITAVHDGDLIEVTKDTNGGYDSEEHIFINIENGGWDKKSFVMLNHDEFKLFVRKCSEIVEWLNA